MLPIPVGKYIEILNIILQEKRSINILAKLTGYKFKPSLTDKIKILEKEELVIRTKDENHKQKQYIELTNLGTELINFYNSLKDVKCSYNVLGKKFAEYSKFAKKEDVVRNSILKNQNWNQIDIECYNDFISGVSLLKNLLVGNISNIIVNRCLYIFINFKVKDIGRSIIKKIFEEFIDFLNEELREFKNDSGIEQKKQIIEEFRKNTIKATINKMYYHFPHVIFDDIKKVCIEYINLINPSKNTMKALLEEEIKINDRERYIIKSNNHFHLGPIHTELAKKDKPDILTSVMFSEVVKKYKFKEEADSKLIKDVYSKLLN